MADEHENKAETAGVGDAPIPGCVDSAAKRYEGAGMNPVTALARAEEDCVDARSANGNDAPDNKSLSAKDSLDDACFKKAIIKHLQAGDIRSDAEAKARKECTDSTPALGEAKALNEKAVEDNVFARVWNALQQRLGAKDDGELTSLKVVGNHWLITWSNDFKDRDGEIFTRKAIDDYVQRVDMGVVPKPELWVWHIGKQVRVGEADWVARLGHFSIAAGSFDGGAAGQAAKAYYSAHAKETGVSHGFSFPAEQFDGKHYHQFNTFEISLLPRGSEANLYTSLEGVKQMALDDRKRKYLETVFGKDHAERMLKDWDERGKALEAFEVEYKDFVATGIGLDGEAINAKAVAAVEMSLKDLFPDVLEGSAEALQGSTEALKAVKEVRAALKDMGGEIDKLRAEMRLAPRSVQSRDGVTETQISKEQAKEEYNADGEEIVLDEFWGVKVKKDVFAALGEEGK